MHELSYFYSDNSLKYFQNRDGYNNKSYILEDKDCYFNAPILYRDDKVESGLISYLPLPYYGGSKGTKRFKQLMKDYLDTLQKYGNIRIALRQDPCVKYDGEIIKCLLNSGFIPHLFYTTIVDLSMSDTMLWNNMRKSYHSLVNNLKNDALKEIVIVDINNCDSYFDDWINLYSSLLARGLVVLSDGARAVLKESLEKGTGFLYLLYQEKNLLAGTHVNVLGTLAYYSAAGTSIQYEHTESYMHYLLYTAMLDLKQRGYTKLEIGPVYYNNVKNFYIPSEKDLSISQFKLGMGGEITPFIIFLKESL